MQITLPFFAFVSLNLMPHSHALEEENIQVPSGYTTDTNEASQIWIMNEKDQPEDNRNDQ